MKSSIADSTLPDSSHGPDIPTSPPSNLSGSWSTNGPASLQTRSSTGLYLAPLAISFSFSHPPSSRSLLVLASIPSTRSISSKFLCLCPHSSILRKRLLWNFLAKRMSRRRLNEEVMKVQSGNTSTCRQVVVTSMMVSSSNLEGRRQRPALVASPLAEESSCFPRWPWNQAGQVIGKGKVLVCKNTMYAEKNWIDKRNRT